MADNAKPERCGCGACVAFRKAQEQLDNAMHFDVDCPQCRGRSGGVCWRCHGVGVLKSRAFTDAEIESAAAAGG